MRAIAHQQLHGRAAQAILARFEALYPADGFPPPELVRRGTRTAGLWLFRFQDRGDAGDLRGGA